MVPPQSVALLAVVFLLGWVARAVTPPRRGPAGLSRQAVGSRPWVVHRPGRATSAAAQWMADAQAWLDRKVNP